MLVRPRRNRLNAPIRGLVREAHLGPQHLVYPLFVQEVLRYLVEEGLVVRQDGRYIPQVDPGVGIPEGLRDVVGKRLSRLSAECNRLLAIAAVIGRDFDLETLTRP
jgi:predicted ATPase